MSCSRRALCEMPEINKSRFHMKIKTFFIFGLIFFSFSCANKTILNPNLPELPPSHGQFFGSIKITEKDCGDLKKPNHEYSLEIIKLRDSGLKSFLLGPIEQVYLIKPPIETKMIFNVALPKGNYILTRLYVGNFMALGVNFDIRFKIDNSRPTVLGHIETLWPCWVTSGEKASYFIKPFDQNDQF